MSEITKLTRGELEVLLDRLEGAGSHCIAESLTDNAWFECKIDDSEEAVEVRADHLLELVKHAKGIPSDLTHLDRVILANCVEASTWQCRGTDAQNVRGIKMLERLASKMISAGVAERIDVPRW